ncbi:MAG: response regulator [bacterium]|nr:response regulator [bacterium]
MSDLRFLVIEDDLFYQTYVNDLFAGTGIDIVNANDGEAGLAMAVAEKPDLIITDIEIPKIQGFVLLKNLRENPETKDIPVIMMSGKVEKDLLERHSRLSTHADGYLLKPFSGQDLLELIKGIMGFDLQSGAAGPGEGSSGGDHHERSTDPAVVTGQLNGQTGGEAAAPAGTAASETPAQKIPVDKAAGSMLALVVDDSQYILDVTKDFLNEMGAEVIVALDGESGFKQAVDTVPDVILLDVQMPGVNGFVVCEKLKKDPATAGIPVILMSAVVDDESFQRHSRLRYHADAYLQKPFMKSELQELVLGFTSSKITSAAGVESKKGFLVPSEDEWAATEARQPERDREIHRKLVEEVKKAREAIEAAKERERQMSEELEGVRRERDGFEEQLYRVKGSVESKEKDLTDKLTLTARRYEESRLEVESLTEKLRVLSAGQDVTRDDTQTARDLPALEGQLAELKRSLDSSIAENEKLKARLADTVTADKLAALEVQAAEYKNNLDLSLTENTQLRAHLADTREVDSLKGQVDDLSSRLESAAARADELAVLNKQLKKEMEGGSVEDEESTRRLRDAMDRAQQADQAKAALERDLAAAVAAKNEIEEQVKTLLADNRKSKRGETGQEKLETLRNENKGLMVRISEAESKTKWLAEVEKQLETVQKEADGLRQELESASREDESAELVTLREKLAATIRRAEKLEADNTELAESMSVVDEIKAERDELSEKTADLEKQLVESMKLAAEEAGSRKAAAERLEGLLQEKQLLEADLEEARKLMDKSDEDDDRVAALEAELAAANKLRAQSEKQVKELRSSAVQGDANAGRISELEESRQELADRLGEVQDERDELAEKVAELSAAPFKAAGEEGGSSGFTDDRLDHLEKILSKTVAEAQAALMEQKDRELALERSVESLMHSLDEERTFFREERDKWRERENELKDAFENALRESRRIMGEEAARLYPMHIPRQARPLEVVTGMRKYGVTAALAAAAVVLFLSGHFILSRFDAPQEKTAVSSGGQQTQPVTRTPEPQETSRPPVPYLSSSGPGDSYEELWRRNTVQSVSEDMMLQATFHTKQELEAAIRYTASKEGWTNERVAKAMGDLASTYDLEESFYVTIFSKNLKGGYPGYADNFERHISLRDGTGHEARAQLPAELERSKFISSRVSAAGKEMNPVFLYEVGLTVAFPRKELGSSPQGLQLVLYDVGAVPMRVLTWDMGAVSSLDPGHETSP